MTPSLLTLFALVGAGLTYWSPIRHWYRHWGATDAEIERTRRGDSEVRPANYEMTLAITVDATPADIWPWLVQLGYRRGGLYSYDWLDRLFGFLDQPSAERIHPEFQGLKVGDVIPVGRGGGFPVTALEPFHSLVLSGESDGIHWLWQLEISPASGRRTRLVSRNRAHFPRTIATTLFMGVLEPCAFIMTRKMLLGLKRRAEATAAQQPHAATHAA